MAPIRTGDIAVPSNHRRHNPSTVTRRPQGDKRKKDGLPGPLNGQEQGFQRMPEMPSIRMDGLVGLPLKVAETLRYYENNPLSWIDEEPIWIGKNTIRYCTRCLPLRHALKVIDLERCSPEAMEFNRAYLNCQFCKLCQEERGLTTSLMPPTTTTTFGHSESSVYSLPTGEVDTRNTYLSAHPGNYRATYAGTSSAMPACHDGMPWCSGASDARLGTRLPAGSWQEMSLLTDPQVGYAQFEDGQTNSTPGTVLCAAPALYYNNPTGAGPQPGWQGGFLAVNKIKDSLRAAVEDEELVHDEVIPQQDTTLTINFAYEAGQQGDVEERNAFWYSPSTTEWFEKRGYILYEPVADDPSMRTMLPKLSCAEEIYEGEYPFAAYDSTPARYLPDMPFRAWEFNGKVMFAQDRQGRHVAIKLVRLETEEYRILEFLRALPLDTLEENCVLPVLDILPIEGFCFVVMPRWGVDINRPTPSTVGQVLQMMRDMLKGLAFLHSHNIIHDVSAAS
ncbi:hypothetical protein CPC08DRAFT_767163 [Agrocybe pediades]|nr:hypothetical protein CPC08DRAFT_767163 [Agrocybe pediades]